MTNAELENAGSVIVRIKDTEYRFGGKRYMLFRTYREFDENGNVILQGANIRDSMDSVIEINAEWLEIERLPYQLQRYKPFRARLSMKRIYQLGGKDVLYEGKRYILKRICKEYNADNEWRYTLVLQNKGEPYTLVEAECFEISEIEEGNL